MTDFNLSDYVDPKDKELLNFTINLPKKSSEDFDLSQFVDEKDKQYILPTEQIQQSTNTQQTNTGAYNDFIAHNVLFGLDPRKILGNVLQLAEVPATISDLVGAPETAESLRPEFVKKASNLGQDLINNAANFYGVTPAITPNDKGSIDIDGLQLLMQEGPLAVLPTPSKITLVNGTNKAAKAINTVGEIATQLALPGVQGKYLSPTGAPLNVAATALVPQAIKFALDNSQQQSEQQSVQQNNIVVPDDFELQQSDQINQQVETPDEFSIDLPEEKTIPTLGAGLALVGGLAAVTIPAIRSALKANKNNIERLDNSILAGKLLDNKTIGEKITKNYTDFTNSLSADKIASGDNIVQKFKTEFVDKSTPLNDVIKQNYDTVEQADSVIRDIHFGFTPQHTQGAIDNAIRTGNLGGIQTISLEEHLTKLSQLSQEELIQYNEGLLAGTMYDNAFNQKANVYGELPVEQLVKIYDDAISNPVVSELMSEARKFYDDATSYMIQEGLITLDAAEQMRVSNPNYIPTQLNIDDPLNYQQLVTRKGAVLPGEAVEPMNVHEYYLSNLIRYATFNKAKIKAVDELVNAGEATLTDLTGLSKEQLPVNHISVINNGKQEIYKLESSHIAEVLENNPKISFPIFSNVKNIFSQFTTGLAKPTFAPVSAIYDSVSSAINISADRNLNSVEKIVKEFAGRSGNDFITYHASKLARMYSIPVTPVAGLIRQGVVKSQQKIGQIVESSIANDGKLKEILGEDLSNHIATVMKNSWENSTLKLFEDRTGTVSNYMQNVFTDPYNPLSSKDFVEKFNSKVLSQIKNTSLAKAYIGLVHAVHKATKIEYVAANRNTVTNVDKLIQEAINNAGDFTKRGGSSKSIVGKATQFTTESIPYYNVGIQVLAKNVGTALNNPKEYTTNLSYLLGSIASVVLTGLQDEEFRKKYIDEMTDLQRAAQLPIVGTNLMIPIENIYRPAVAMLVNALIALDTGIKQDPYYGDTWLESLLNFGFIPDPTNNPTIKAGYSLYQGMVASGQGAVDAQLRPFPTLSGLNSRAGEFSVYRDPTDTSIEATALQQAVMAVMGGSSQAFLGAVDAFGKSLGAKKSILEIGENTFDKLFEPNIKTFSNIFGGVDKVPLAFDRNAKYISDREGTMNALQSTYNERIKNNGGMSRKRPNMFNRQISDNQDLRIIGSSIENFKKINRVEFAQLNYLKQQIKRIDKDVEYFDLQKSNKAKRELRLQIRELEKMKVKKIADLENKLSIILNRPFSFTTEKLTDYQT